MVNLCSGFIQHNFIFKIKNIFVFTIMGFGTMEHVYCLQVGSHVGDSPNDTLFVQDLSDKNIILIEPVPYLF